MKDQEKDRIGLVLHLSQPEYTQLAASWQFHLPEAYQSTFDGLMQCRYAAIALSEQWKAIVSIEEWCFATREGGLRVAKLSCISEEVTRLKVAIFKDICGTKWLTNYQQEAIEKSLGSGAAQFRPEILPPCLDFNAAADAVSRHYGVEPNQVQVSIHRK